MKSATVSVDTIWISSEHYKDWLIALRPGMMLRDLLPKGIAIAVANGQIIEAVHCTKEEFDNDPFRLQGLKQ